MMVAETRERILEAARLTVQDLGYQGLSFRELAKDVGIKSASIHYYFPTKGVLGATLASRYTDDFASYLDGLLAEGLDMKTCMARYTEVFASTLRNGNRMCLAGILAAERNDVPQEVRVEIVRYAEMNERWLERVLALSGSGKPAGSKRRARAIYAAVAGAQLVAHGRGDVSVFEGIISTYRANGLIP